VFNDQQRIKRTLPLEISGHWRPTHDEPSQRRLKADFVNVDPSDIFPLVAGHWVPSMSAVKLLCTLVAVHYAQFGDGARRRYSAYAQRLTSSTLRPTALP
jgi:hypothetical protein